MSSVLILAFGAVGAGMCYWETLCRIRPAWTCPLVACLDQAPQSRACLVCTAGSLLCLLGLGELSSAQGHMKLGQESQTLGQELLWAEIPRGSYPFQKALSKPVGREVPETHILLLRRGRGRSGPTEQA